MLDEYGNYLPAPRERYWDNHPLHVPERPDPAEVAAYNRAFYAGIGSEQDRLLPGGMDAVLAKALAKYHGYKRSTGDA